MTVGQFALSVEATRELRARHPYAPDQTWVPEVVRSAGWEAANIRYLQGERARSVLAMRDLLGALGIERPRTPEEAVDLIALAMEVFAPDEGFGGTVTRMAPAELRMANPVCPTYALIEQQGWLGVTACPSWHRRRGWIDALGVEATDSVLREKKWGDLACVCVLSVSGILPR